MSGKVGKWIRIDAVFHCAVHQKSAKQGIYRCWREMQAFIMCMKELQAYSCVSLDKEYEALFGAMGLQKRKNKSFADGVLEVKEDISCTLYDEVCLSTLQSRH